jgi:beta-lactamase regulating signal transducer with metallopeptidase domain
MTLFPIADAFSRILPGPMHLAADAFRFFAHAAAPIAVASLWQGAAVAAGLAVFLRLAPRISAAHRFAAWAAAFATLICLPLLTLLAHAGVEAADAAGASAGPVQQAFHPWLELDARWSLGLAALWAAMAALRAAGLALHSLRLRRLWRSATPIEDSLAASLVPALHCCGPVQICTTSELDRPSVIGFLAPRILIPDWLFARLTRQELEQVVLHEAEHLRRRDDWTNLLQKLCLVLFPLNPALVWIERRLSKEREMASDEGVVRVTQAPRAYAACLASVAERGLARRSEALSLGAFERRPELVHRVHTILRRKKTLHPLAARALLGVLGCGLVFGAVEFARCPQMVAFVPAHTRPARTLAANRQQPQTARFVPAAYQPLHAASDQGGFRAIQAKAVLPISRVAATPAVTSNQQRAAIIPAAGSQSRAVAWETAYKESSFGSQRPAVRASATDPSAAPQWIVLTTWEQVQSWNSNETADYDIGAGADQAAPGVSSAGESANRITVTRLILSVYPASSVSRLLPGKQAAPASRPNTSTDSKPNSVSAHTAALPLGSGWLVIQL